jgi:hypothetical protein
MNEFVITNNKLTNTSRVYLQVVSSQIWVVGPHLDHAVSDDR